MAYMIIIYSILKSSVHTYKDARQMLSYSAYLPTLYFIAPPFVGCSSNPTACRVYFTFQSTPYLSSLFSLVSLIRIQVSA
mmetsp:Transcript_23983/g.60727  ORF Transcript_23983/g.60727 Transcript_23983/m.60727 type:complete len:80 (+) Transcript_23983:198-437(+)